MGYGHEEKGECSKVAEAKTISSPSDSKQGIKPTGPHQFKENGSYKAYSNSSVAYKRNDCFHRSSNHAVAKNHAKKVWVKKTDLSTRGETK